MGYSLDKYQKYNEEVVMIKDDYRTLNGFVMNHTNKACKHDERLVESIAKTLQNQFVLLENDGLDVAKDGPTTNIIFSESRSFEAAKKYKDKKVAVLNFANNHSIGGAPFSAGAQEESLCRISTLYRCLKNEKESFYELHHRLYYANKIDRWGNNDLIYSPDVVVFKTDESAPKMMDENDWYKVDVITCAAPELRGGFEGSVREYKKRILQNHLLIQELRK